MALWYTWARIDIAKNWNDLHPTHSATNYKYTTGLPEFAECPKHSAKDIKHSANGSPSVTPGE